jgi:ABC-type nitrate/sulfonate/bicarbonate transport system permease component
MRAARRASRGSSAAGDAARTVLAFAVLVAVWWLLARRAGEFVLPAPDRVLERAREDRALVLEQALITLRRVLTAYALACVAGVVLGTLIGRLRAVRAALRPVVSFLFPVPKIALYPAMVIVFGLGSASKVAFGFAEALFPILLATAAGTSQVPRTLLWSAAVLGSGRAAALVRVVVPAALPAILTGARIGLVGAIIGVFLAEMIAGGDGLGQLMATSYRTLDTPGMYVAILTVSLLGYALDRAFRLAAGFTRTSGSP